jgi:glycosyltransferase involved in cell wall biosynthesis
LREEPGKYLAFLGRVSPEKGLDRAIQIARRAGIHINIAAKVDKADGEYFDSIIRPLLSEPGVEFIGEIGQDEKEDFLSNAIALVFPIDWPEPFGLVMIEAMACGTPVLAFRRGSVPEIMVDGLTGTICETVEQAVSCIERVVALSRRKCREVYEERFTSERMASDYLRIYMRMINRYAKTSERAIRGRYGRDLEEGLVPDPGNLVPSA